jgi:hypothetical protein
MLESLQPGQITTEIKGMVGVACRCVAILEPWNQAKFVHSSQSYAISPLSPMYDGFRSQHPTSEKIIKRVQEDFDRFFDVLVKSKEIARNGCKAMKDIAYTCSQLSRPTQPTGELMIFVNQVSLPVGQADRQSKLIRTEFREARIRVIEVSP